MELCNTCVYLYTWIFWRKRKNDILKSILKLLNDIVSLNLLSSKYCIIIEWQLQKLSKKHQEYFTAHISLIFAPLYTYEHRTITLAPDSKWRERTEKIKDGRCRLRFSSSRFCHSPKWIVRQSRSWIDNKQNNSRNTHFHVAAC